MSSNPQAPLKQGLKVLAAIPNLADGDSYAPFVKNATRRIEKQKCPVPTTIYVTPPFPGRFDLGHKSRLDAITNRLNHIVDHFMGSGCTHLWIVDADVEPPDFALDTLLRMNVDVASGVYSFHNDRNVLMFGRMRYGDKSLMIPRGFIGFSGDGIIGQDFRVGGGNGCLLVKRRVFQQYDRRVAPIRFDSTWANGSDVNFWYQCQEAGFVCRVNANVKCGHLSSDPKRNIPLESYYEDAPPDA